MSINAKKSLFTLLFILFFSHVSAQNVYFFSGQNGLLGVKEVSGKVLVEPKYHGGRKFKNGMAVVKGPTIMDDITGFPISPKSGYINDKGVQITPLKYDYAYDFEEGMAAVKINYLFGFIDDKGNEVIPLKYESASRFNEGLAYVKLNGKLGYIDKKGKIIIPFIYDKASMFKNGVASVHVGADSVVIDKTGKKIN